MYFLISTEVNHPLNLNTRLHDEMVFSNRAWGIFTAANFSAKFHVESQAIHSTLHNTLQYLTLSVMRSELYMYRLETLHCEPTAIRWGKKTGTDHIRKGVQEIISCISHISGTNSVTNVTSPLFSYITSQDEAFSQVGCAAQNPYQVHTH